MNKFFAILAMVFGLWSIAILSRGDLSGDVGTVALFHQSFRPWAISGLLLTCGGWSFLNRALLIRSLQDALKGQLHVERRTAHQAIGVLTIFGFAMRLSAASLFGLNPDEAQLVWAVQADSFRSVWELVKIASPHPYPFFAVLHTLHNVSDNLMWLRLISIVPGAYLIVASYWFASKLHGRTIGILVAFFVCFSPGLVDLSRVCRNYALPAAFMLTAFVFLVEFFRTRRIRPYAIFVASMIASISFHYAYIVAVVGANIAILFVFLRRHEPWQFWVKVASGQLPLAGVIAGYYFLHIAQLPDNFVATLSVYTQRAMVNPLATPLKPLLDFLAYFLPQFFAVPVLLLALSGAVYLALSRNGWKLILHIAPLVGAYIFLYFGKMPFGSSRHSSYLIFSMLCLASLGTVHLTTTLRLLTARLSGITLMGRIRPAIILAAGVLVIIVPATYGYKAIAEYGTSVRRLGDPLSMHARRGEFLRYYTTEDINRAFMILEERVSDGDIVILTFPSLMQTRLHYDIEANPTLDKGAPQDFRWPVVPLQPTTYAAGRIHYYFSRPLVFGGNAEALAKTYTRVKARYRLPTPESVWCVQGGFEPLYSSTIPRRFPGIPFDEDLSEATGGLLFRIEPQFLEALLSESNAPPS